MIKGLRSFFYLSLAVVLSCGLSADIQKGQSTGTISRDMAHITVGSRPIQKIEVYKGGSLKKVWEDLETPTITAFNAVPTSIDLDTRPTGNIVFTIGVTGTPATQVPVPSAFSFVEQTTRNGNWFLNSISGNGFSTIGTRAFANSNLKALDFFNSAYTGNTFLRNKYLSHWLRSYIRNKFPVNLRIGSTDYPLRFVTIYTSSGVPITEFSTTSAVGTAGDRVSATSLSKQVNFEFVDNISTTFSGSTILRPPRSDGLFTLLGFCENQGSVVIASASCNANGYIFLRPLSDTKTYTHLTVNGEPFALVKTLSTHDLTEGNVYHTASVSVNSRPSNGTTFGLNALASDGTYLNNTRSYMRTGPQSGTGNTYAQIVRLPDGANIGPTQTATSGLNINTTVSNIPQPNRTTTYRLLVHNGAGNAHKDTTIVVTKNPTLSNCRRTGYIDATTTYFFGFTVTGLPQPTVTYRFSGGQQGTVSSRHFVQGSNPYTWTVSGRAWQIDFANANAQSLTLTATNSSGSTTCSISNIND